MLEASDRSCELARTFREWWAAHHSHGLSQYEDECLVGHSDGARQEKVGQGDVEEREGGEDGLG